MLPGAAQTLATAPRTLMMPGVGQELNVDGVAADFPGLNASANSKRHLLYFSCGQNDGQLATNQQFMDWLTTQGIEYEKMIVPGYAHEWPFWRISLADLTPKLFN